VVFDGDGQVLLADFGMAGLGHAPDDPGGLTPAFAAPERLRGAPPSDASDVYSMAVTLRSASAQPVPEEVERLLANGAAASPADRPSAAELADALRSLLPR
jgi:serine/threonine protein kinase